MLERAWHGHASIADRLRCTYPMSAMTTGDPSHVGDAPGCQSRSRTAQITPARQCQCRYAGNPCLVLTLPAPESAHDHCPLCQADLGKPRGATRRRIVFTATPGTFRWQCPDCRGVWQVDTRVAARA